jgi:hypothetical protein
MAALSGRSVVAADRRKNSNRVLGDVFWIKLVVEAKISGSSDGLLLFRNALLLY